MSYKLIHDMTYEYEYSIDVNICGFFFSVYNKSNKITLHSFNVSVENKFETNTEEDCKIKSVQKYMYIKEDDCYIIDNTDNFPITSSSLLG